MTGHDGEKACALLAPETRAELEQSGIRGWKQFTADRFAQGLDRLRLVQYLTSSDFAIDVAES